MYQQILVPLDGSPVAEAALPLVRPLARALGSAVTLFHVLPSPPADPEALVRMQDQAAAAFRPLAEQLTAAGITTDVIVTAGRPADEILRVAQQGRYDLVAMGTKGERGLGGFYFGSVAWQALHRSPAPVLLVRQNAARPDAAGEQRVRRILAPLDGSLTAEEVLPHAEALAAAFDADLYLVRVALVTPVIFADPGVAPYVGRLQEDLLKEAQAYLDDVVQRIGPKPYKVSSLALMGPAAAQIVDLARRLEDSMVAMTTHARAGVTGFLLGSVAAQVAQHSGDPVLLVRPGRVGANS